MCDRRYPVNRKNTITVITFGRNNSIWFSFILLNLFSISLHPVRLLFDFQVYQISLSILSSCFSLLLVSVATYPAMSIITTFLLFIFYFHVSFASLRYIKSDLALESSCPSSGHSLLHHFSFAVAASLSSSLSSCLYICRTHASFIFFIHSYIHPIFDIFYFLS